MSEVFLPKVFGGIISRMDIMDNIDSMVFEAYVDALLEEETFVSEFLSIVGSDTFRLLVKYLGGQVIRIPKPQDIVSEALVFMDENEEL